MKNQLIPPPEFAPPSIGHLSVKERIELWAQMVDEGDQLVLAALRRDLGPDADLVAAFTEWLDRRSDEKIRELRAVAETRRRERKNGE
jgi:hypothetical protein